MTLCLLFTAVSLTNAQENFATFPLLAPGYTSIKVFDNQKRFVGRILPEKRYWVTIDRIPVFLQKAVVAVEDARFYEHGGIDVRGIARALVKDVVKRRFAEGGSTITQQLIKNRYLTGAKTLERKIDEARLAIEFEGKYSKQQILEMYFNEIYYGNGAWGIVQASRLYFDKNPEELSDAECAMLAGVQKNPSRYNPLGKPEQVTSRRDAVLRRMVEVNMITAAYRQQLRAHPPAVVQTGQAPQYVSHVKAKLVERYGFDIIEQGGLEVTAALDLSLQRQAEQYLREAARRISPGMQGALICLDTATGDVLAAVGGVDTTQGGYNRAFTARRQPGSTIKPFIYAAALEQGITAGSIWNDAPVAYNRGNGELWKPLNYGREQYGDLSLRQALAHSNNVITVKLLESVGVGPLVDFTAKVGLPVRAQNGLSLALGTDEVTLNDLVLAYTPFATGGLRPEARVIIRIYDSRRRTWLENPPVVTPVLDPGVAYITTSMLKDVMEYGTAKKLKKFSQAHPAAGKTGTTDDGHDAWFVGYTPQLITGIWLGYDKPRAGGKGFTGGVAAAPIWERFMRSAVAGKPPLDFVKPDAVVSVDIDPTTGLLATPDCPEKQVEVYITGTEPHEYCPAHGGTPLLPEPAPSADPNAGGKQTKMGVDKVTTGVNE
ncbi:MAG: PBP1A family penicillin-binding protein [Desulfuromonadaceae bacterium]|nr:PBP1A family penicillin-binding protein [Desulfuromonadaceae bacterium]